MSEFNFTAQLPMKRMAAAALLLNDDRRILLVKPTYRENWLLPGGVVEAHESPGAACIREVKEELGLQVHLGSLLCMEYRSTAPPKTESLQFVFSGGVLTLQQIRQIKLPLDEISAFCFASIDEAQEKLEALSARRVQWAWQALQEQRTIYAEDGVEQNVSR
jgi:ADP-ribose pyrophosphatase YjhB (NUDIX family)